MKLSPRKATSIKRLCSLNRDNVDTKDYWISVDWNTVTLTAQRIGEKPTQQIKISRKSFNKFVDFYNREQKVNPTKLKQL